MCLARRGLQLLCRGCRPVAVLEALWKLEGLRAEWHMELSAAGTN